MLKAADVCPVGVMSAQWATVNHAELALKVDNKSATVQGQDSVNFMMKWVAPSASDVALMTMGSNPVDEREAPPLNADQDSLSVDLSLIHI